MSATGSDAVSPQHNTYADYIEHEFGQSHEWLLHFLRHGSEKRKEYTEPFCSLQILDSVNVVLHSQSFDHKQRETVEAQCLEVIRNIPLETKTRIILLSCEHLTDFSPCYIDALGLHYKLDPHFIGAHLDYCRHISEESPYAGLRPRPPLPSQRTYLQSFRNHKKCITASLEAKDGVSLVFILELRGFGDERVGIPHGHPLPPNTPETIRKCDEKPADYLLPLLRDAAEQASAACNQLARFADFRSVDSGQYTGNQANHRAMLASRRSLQQWLARPGIADLATKHEFDTLVNDYTTLIEDSTATGTDMQGHLQQEANRAAIEETRRGISQGESIRRLTLVAFIFIPLSFATSFFGMNLKQLDSGTLNIGYFFLLAILASALSFALGAGAHQLQTSRQTDKLRYLQFKGITRDNEYWNDRWLDQVTRWQAQWGLLWFKSPWQWYRRQRNAREGKALINYINAQHVENGSLDISHS